MRKIFAVIGGVALVAVAVVALAGWAGGWCSSGGHGRGGHGRDPAAAAAFATARVEDALDDVDATPEQRARIFAVKDRMVEAAMGLHGDHRETHDAIFAEWKAERPDAAKLHALVETRAEEMKALAHQAVDAGVEVHGILTPEQREKLTRKMERRHR